MANLTIGPVESNFNLQNWLITVEPHSVKGRVIPWEVRVDDKILERCVYVRIMVR